MKPLIKLNKIKELLGMEVKLEQWKLLNGTIIEAEVFEADQEVFIITEEARIALPVGEYKIEDGKILVVREEGIIAEIKEAEAEKPEAAPEAAAEPELEDKTTPKKVIESISKEIVFSKEQKNEIKQMFIEFKAELLEELKPKVEVKAAEVEPKVKEVIELEEEKPIKPSPEAEVEKKELNLYAQKNGMSLQSRVYDKINNN